MDDHTKCIVNSMLLGAAVSSLADVSYALLHGTFKSKQGYECMNKLIAYVDLIQGARDNMTSTCGIPPKSEEEVALMGSLQDAVQSIVSRNKLPTRHEARAIHETAENLRATLFNGLTGGGSAQVSADEMETVSVET